MLFDSDPATFTVTAVNDAPVVGNIPDQTIAEGGTFTTINLDDYVSDVDNTDAEMTWTYSGNTDLTVSIVDRVATIMTPSADWTGSETITFTATDPGLLPDSDPATFTVTGDMFVQTVSVGGITKTSATVVGEVIKLGEPRPIEIGICWSEDPEPTTDDNKAMIDPPFVEDQFILDISILNPGTAYYLRAYARNAQTTVYGNELSFTTLIEPGVQTLATDRIGDTTARGNGYILKLGVPEPFQHGVLWNKSGIDLTLQNNDGFTTEGPVSVIGSFTSNIMDLIPNTTYYVRAYATNAVDTVYGDHHTLLLRIHPPQVLQQRMLPIFSRTQQRRMAVFQI